MAMMPRYPEEGSYTSDTCSCSCSSSSANSAVASSFFALARERAGDDDALDFTGAFIDLGDLCIPEEFLDGEISHVAVPPEELNCLRRDPHRRFGCEQLRHAGVERDILARIFASRRPMRQRPRRFRACGHVGELELHRLEVRDRLLELPALGAILDGKLQGFPCNSHSLSPNPQPPGIEAFHRVDEPHPLLAQHLTGGGAEIVQRDAPRVRCPEPHLVFWLPRRVALGVLLPRETR